MKYHAAERKKGLLPFSTTWMELENIMLSEISQSVNDQYSMISPEEESNEQNKLTNKIEPQAWNHGSLIMMKGKW